MFLRFIAIGLVVLGFVLVIVGLSGMTGKVEEAPTAVPIAVVEKGELPPDVKWVKVTDGQLYWPARAKLAIPDKKGKETGPELFYVPVLSDDAVAAMTSNEKPWSLGRCRLFAVVKEDALKAKFPEAVNVDAAMTPVGGKMELDGTLEPMTAADSLVRDHFAQSTSGLDVGKVNLLMQGQKPVQRGVAAMMTLPGAVMVLVGVGLYLMSRAHAKRLAAEAAAAHHHKTPVAAVPVAAIPVAAIPVTETNPTPKKPAGE